MYVKNQQDVLLVVNADCDLAYSANNPNRPFPADLSILLHPGRLVPPHESVPGGTKVTNLFVVDGKSYKIVWDHRKVVSKTYSEAKQWLVVEGYSKVARLAAPHALEIQQHFAAQLTRVGMPVAPPLARSATVQVFGKTVNDTVVKLGEDIPQCVIIDKEGFRFTGEGFRDILDRVNAGLDYYHAERKSMPKVTSITPNSQNTSIN